MNLMKGILREINFYKIMCDIISISIKAICIIVLFCCAAKIGLLPEKLGINNTNITWQHCNMMFTSIYIPFMTGIIISKGILGKYHIDSIEHKEDSEDTQDLTVHEIQQLQRIAIHEAGHIVMASQKGKKITEAHILGLTGKLCGEVLHEAGPILMTDELKDEVMIAYAGLSAERNILGSPAAGCMGSSTSDLELAYSFLKQYVILTDPEIGLHGEYCKPDIIKEKIEELSQKWYTETDKIIKEYTSEIIENADILLEKYKKENNIKQELRKETQTCNT